MKSRLVSVVTLSLSLGAGASAVAGEIYHWVDEQGVQHFSQTAPVSAAGTVETMTMEDYLPPQGGEAEDVYDVAAIAERTQALREEMDKRRAERLDRQRREAAQPVQQYPEPVHYAAPWWWDGPGYQRPPRPPRPEQPPVPEPYPTATLRPPGRTSG